MVRLIGHGKVLLGIEEKQIQKEFDKNNGTGVIRTRFRLVSVIKNKR